MHLMHITLYINNCIVKNATKYYFTLFYFRVAVGLKLLQMTAGQVLQVSGKTIFPAPISITLKHCLFSFFSSFFSCKERKRRTQNDTLCISLNYEYRGVKTEKYPDPSKQKKNPSSKLTHFSIIFQLPLEIRIHLRVI